MKNLSLNTRTITITCSACTIQDFVFRFTTLPSLHVEIHMYFSASAQFTLGYFFHQCPFWWSGKKTEENKKKSSLPLVTEAGVCVLSLRVLLNPKRNFISSLLQLRSSLGTASARDYKWQSRSAWFQIIIENFEANANALYIRPCLSKSFVYP